MELRSAICLSAAALLLAGCATKEPEPPYRVFVTNEGSGDVTVINPVSLKVMATIPLGKRPRGIHLGPDGKLFVALSGHPNSPPGVDESTLPPPDKSADGVGIFDVVQNKLIRTIPGGANPEQLSLSKDGSIIYVANQDTDGLTLLDLASGKDLGTVPTGEEPEGITSSPDGRFVYVTSETEGTVTQVDTAARKVGKQTKACNHPRTVIATPDGTRIAVACENDGSVAILDAVTLDPVQTIRVGKQYKVMGMAITKDGSTLYVTSGRGKTLFALDLKTYAVRDTWPLTGTRSWGVALSPDEKLLFTANGPSDNVTVVSTDTGKIVADIKAGTLPWGVTVVPNAAVH